MTNTKKCQYLLIWALLALAACEAGGPVFATPFPRDCVTIWLDDSVSNLGASRIDQALTMYQDAAGGLGYDLCVDYTDNKDAAVMTVHQDLDLAKEVCENPNAQGCAHTKWNHIQRRVHVYLGDETYKVTAHELGHYFIGCDYHHHHDRRSVMYPATGTGVELLPEDLEKFKTFLEESY